MIVERMDVDMKLSFSTLGCPYWDLDTIIKRAKMYGFQGIEIRGIKDQLDVTQLPEFRHRINETRNKFLDAEIELVCFASSIRMSEPEKSKRAEHIEELKRYAERCEKFNTPFIRIFGGDIGELSWDQAIEQAAITLFQMSEILDDLDSKIIVETHENWMAADHFKALMELVDSKNIGILWDVNHPFMFIGEAPEQTWEKVGKWVYHTHWKDSKIAPDTALGFTPCLMGEGDLPHRQIYDVLKQGGYHGYLSFEWEKRWHPELPDPEIAFPQYIEYMKRLMEK